MIFFLHIFCCCCCLLRSNRWFCGIGIWILVCFRFIFLALGFFYFYCSVSVTDIGLLHSRELIDLELHRLYRICDLSVKHKHRTITVTYIRVSPTLLCRSYHHKVLLSHFKHIRKHDTKCVSEDNKFSLPRPSRRQHLPSMFIS